MIPPELRALGWVLWRATPDGPGKPKKVPYRIADPSTPASSTDPETWASFEDAVEAYAMLAGRPADPVRGPIAGYGVVLTLAAGVTCLDLDGVVRADDSLDVRAETIVDRCDSWTERSPSGTGLHVFVLGRLPAAIKGVGIEVYSAARYIAVTGHRWPGTPDRLRPQQDYLEHLARAARGPERPPPRPGPSIPPPDDLARALLAKLQTLGIPGTRVKRWSGGYLVELAACPWAAEHTSGDGGAAVMIHPSGAYDFTCLHAHCSGRGWQDFRAVMECRR
jgi:hypothetical protein